MTYTYNRECPCGSCRAYGQGEHVNTENIGHLKAEIYRLRAENRELKAMRRCAVADRKVAQELIADAYLEAREREAEVERLRAEYERVESERAQVAEAEVERLRAELTEANGLIRRLMPVIDAARALAEDDAWPWKPTLSRDVILALLALDAEEGERIDAARISRMLGCCEHACGGAR